MKKTKKLIIVLFLSLLSSSLLFSQAKGGFVFSLVDNGSFGVVDISEDSLVMNTSGLIQTGYIFGLAEGLGVSLVTDIGYSYNYSFSILDDIGDNTDVIHTTKVHSLQLGLMPSFNLSRFSFGLGVGIKIPLDVSSILSSNNEVLGGTTTFEKGIDGNYNPTPYLKLQMDYSLFIDTRTAVVLGLSAQYDFDASGEHPSASPENFYLGFLVGFKIGPKL